jgi:hypothetical protein
VKPLVAIAALLLSPLVVAQGAIARRRPVAVPTPVITHRTVTLQPSRDNTLYETPDGLASNGKGARVFAGMTASGSHRRALLAFDIRSQIPPGSQITRVVLTLTVSIATSGPQVMSLHRVNTDWGEGASLAQWFGLFGRGDGHGAEAKAGDATWLHAFFPDKRWTNAGGDFDSYADATVTSGSTDIRWESAALITRVQQWLDQPSTNFGWIVIGNESSFHTAKGFGSRESSGTAPTLMIEFDARQ